MALIAPEQREPTPCWTWTGTLSLPGSFAPRPKKEQLVTVWAHLWLCSPSRGCGGSQSQPSVALLCVPAGLCPAHGAVTQSCPSQPCHQHSPQPHTRRAVATSQPRDLERYMGRLLHLVLRIKSMPKSPNRGNPGVLRGGW